MQHSAAHTMRLRSRPSGNMDQNAVQKTRRRGPILEDISNRVGGDEIMNSKEQSKNKETSKSLKTKTIQMEAIQQRGCKVQKPRRLSARLQEIRDREKENSTKSCCDSKAPQNVSKASNVEEVQAGPNFKQNKKRRQILKHILPLKETKESKANANTLKRQAKRRRTSDVGKSVIGRSKRARVQDLDPIVMVEHIRENEDEYHVHPDFRLHRATFNGRDLTMGMAKHDRANKGDVLQAAPYVTDIFQHHFILEGKTHPRTYMKDQTDINAKMRAILIDWLIEVHMKFRLVPETLYLCINIIDRYCSLVRVKRAKLQLVGVTALLIACKYEEIYPPEVRDCVYITDSAYQREEVLDMEQNIVHKLGFRITVPTAYPFLQRFLTILKASPIIKHTASYYSERTLQEHDMLHFRPSLICVSAIVLAINNPDIGEENRIDEDIACKSGEWPQMPPILLEYTGFTRREIILCAEIVAHKVAEEPVTASKRQLVAVKKKYDNKKYLNVSTGLRLPSIALKKDGTNEGN